jgi:hypothetical protein
VWSTALNAIVRPTKLRSIASLTTGQPPQTRPIQRRLPPLPWERTYLENAVNSDPTKPMLSITYGDLIALPET